MFFSFLVRKTLVCLLFASIGGSVLGNNGLVGCMVAVDGWLDGWFQQ